MQNHIRGKVIITSLLVMGFSGLVAQVLCLREFLIIFSGNELSIGIILANWLILEALGAFFLGKRAEHLKQKLEAFVIIQFLFSISLPCMIFLIRIWKSVLGVLPAESLGIIPLIYSSFLLLAPISITHGALFTFGCKLYSSILKKEAETIGRTYIYETLGTMTGGVFFTYLLIPYFNSFKIAFIVSLMNIALCLVLLSIWKKRDSRFRKFLSIFSLVSLILFAFFIFSGTDKKIHLYSVKSQWKGEDIVDYRNSIYGNIVVVKRGEQYTFFSGGLPILNTPTPDITFVEEFAHLPLLSHPNPQEILIISGGAGGLIREILKHDIKRIDYAELDPLIIEEINKFPTPLTQYELKNPLVNIKHTDGRLFAKETTNQYDVALIGLSEPSTLQVNRLFTEEFFSLLKKILKDDGVVAISLPGSLTYLNEELSNLNSCILNTLKGVYPYVRVIPGDFNIFLASSSEGISSITPTELVERLRKREIKTKLLTEEYINYRLDKRWLGWFMSSINLADTDEGINRDFLPLGTYYYLQYWNALFSPYMRGMFKWIDDINLNWVFLFLALFVAIFVTLNLKTHKFRKSGLFLAILSTGFAGMIFNLVLIFAFQVVYGYLYHWIGILVAVFMVGVGIGGTASTRLLYRIKKDLHFLISIEIVIVVFSLILGFLLSRFNLYSLSVISLKMVFLLLCFASGFLIGVEFPLANKIYLKHSPYIAHTAGLLYASDLLGGWVGGMVGGVILLSLLGLVTTCMIVAVLKASSILILTSSAKSIG
jgi:spermidine synthase